MAEASLIISVLALAMSMAVAGFGIWFQWRTYQATTKDVADFRGQITNAAEKIDGRTEALLGHQQTQFQAMLDAFVAAPRTVTEAAEGTTRSLDALELVQQTLDQIRSQIANEERPDRLKQIEAKVDQMEAQLAAARQETRTVERSLREGRDDSVAGLLARDRKAILELVGLQVPPAQKGPPAMLRFPDQEGGNPKQSD